MNVLRLGAAEIELHDDGLTVTRYGGRATVEAAAQDGDAYRRTAQELGYGGDTARMSREHELSHSLLAHWLGLPASPTLIGHCLSLKFPPEFCRGGAFAERAHERP